MDHGQQTIDNRPMTADRDNSLQWIDHRPWIKTFADGYLHYIYLLKTPISAVCCPWSVVRGLLSAVYRLLSAVFINVNSV
ncbi:MAG: hypothetical protein ABJB16_06055 [Saprospiraceae bacterium]